jgi:hypothetical protein
MDTRPLAQVVVRSSGHLKKQKGATHFRYHRRAWPKGNMAHANVRMGPTSFIPVYRIYFFLLLLC